MLHVVYYIISFIIFYYLLIIVCRYKTINIINELSKSEFEKIGDYYECSYFYHEKTELFIKYWFEFDDIIIFNNHDIDIDIWQINDTYRLKCPEFLLFYTRMKYKKILTELSLGGDCSIYSSSRIDINNKISDIKKSNERKRKIKSLI